MGNKNNGEKERENRVISGFGIRTDLGGEKFLRNHRTYNTYTNYGKLLKFNRIKDFMDKYSCTIILSRNL